MLKGDEVTPETVNKVKEAIEGLGFKAGPA